MDRRKLLVGAYFFNKELWNEEGMKDLIDSGIEFLVSVPVDKRLLSLCETYNIGMITTSHFPLWWGDNGQKRGQYATTYPLENLNAVSLNYVNSPALWGDYPVDEPAIQDYAHTNKIVERYKELFPGQLPYINLYPNYANTEQMGCITYQEYIYEYVKQVDTDYICFDFYPFQNHNITLTQRLFSNLDIVSGACRKSGRDMWVIDQTGARTNEQILESQIRWQSYMSLAYGAKIIIHACYSKGWWNDKTVMVNSSAQKNATYEYVVHINRELHGLSDVYMQHDNTGVLIFNTCDKSDPLLESFKEQNISSLNRGFTGDGFFGSLESEGAVLTGFFDKRGCDQEKAVMLVNVKNIFEGGDTQKVSFKISDADSITAYVKGFPVALKSENNNFTLTLQSGEGVFITYMT